MSKEHAELSASSAHRWFNCPASYQMSKDIPQTTSPLAEHGTLLHNIAEASLTSNTKYAMKYAKLSIDDRNIVDTYCDYIKQIPGDLFLETRVNYDHWVTDGFGTVDALVFNDNILHVVDLKTGRGVRVDAEDNMQLVLYALGALQSFPSRVRDVEIIHMVIHQQSLGHVDHWSIPKEDLLHYGRALKFKAEEAFGDNPTFNPSEATCKFCPAKGICKAYNDKALKLLRDEFFSNVDEDTKIDEDSKIDKYNKLKDSITNDELRVMYEAIPTIEKWIKTVKETVHNKLEQGEEIKGYKLVEGRKTRKWKLTEKQILRRLKKFGIDEDVLYKKTFLSVAQVEKIVGKDYEDFKDFYTSESSGVKIASEHSDAKEACSLKELRELIKQ